MKRVYRKLSFLIITLLLTFVTLFTTYGAGYTIPGIEAYKYVDYNREMYWPRFQYPYLYDWFGLGEFDGCCHANSSLQICLYYDDIYYDLLVDNPHTPQSTQQAQQNDLKAMAKLVEFSYKPGWMKFLEFWKQFPPDWKTAVEFYADLKGYNFKSNYCDGVEAGTIKTELQNNRPVQVLLYSEDRVVVEGYEFKSFAHSTMAVGYEETMAEFKIKLYWGWGKALPQVVMPLGSDFDQQFENKGMIVIHPCQNAIPVITQSLQLLQSPPYYVGDTITATFTITNKGSLPITFQILTVGGRGPGGETDVQDFTHRTNITLNPNQSYPYEGTLKLSKPGNYHFFCAYQTPDGNWNTKVDLGPGLTDADRVKDIIVTELPKSTKFKPGDYIKVTSPAGLNIRQTPAGVEITTLENGSTGRVLSHSDNGIYEVLDGTGYYWWYVEINKNDGKTYTGWCAEDWLQKISLIILGQPGLPKHID